MPHKSVGSNGSHPFKAAVEMCLDFLSADYAHLFSAAFVAETGRAQAIAGNF